MIKITDICNRITDIDDENKEMRRVLCADIAFASKFIKRSTFPQSKTFGTEITKIFNILDQYYKPNSKAKGNIFHRHLKDREFYKELVALSHRTDPEALSLILFKVPKYHNILTLFELYSIVRIVHEFSIEYAQYVKTSYYEERLKLTEK